MAVSTVAVAGGSGTVGSATCAALAASGYEVVVLDRRAPSGDAAARYVATDLLDAGEAYGALAESGADAVVHMGTIPRPGGHPAHRTYESNVQSAVHVLEASEALGVEAVCLASSVNAVGSEHQTRPADVRYLPVDEAHPRTPSDVYGVAKHAMEVTADGYGRRPDSDLTIASLRFPWVVGPAEVREHLAGADRSLDRLGDLHPATGRDVLFSYLHLEDAAAAAVAAVEADFEGHEVFWTTAADTTMAVPSRELAETCFPTADLRADLEGHDSLVDCSKAGALLDWEPTRTWREVE